MYVMLRNNRKVRGIYKYGDGTQDLALMQVPLRKCYLLH